MTSFFTKEGNLYKARYRRHKKIYLHICQSQIPKEMNMGVTRPFAIVDHVHNQLSSSLLENFVCRNRESILKDLNCRLVTLEWFSIIQILVNFETLKLSFSCALQGSKLPVMNKKEI